MPKHIIADKGSSFTSRGIEEQLEQNRDKSIPCDNQTCPDFWDDRKVTSAYETNSQNQRFADRPQWDGYVNLAVMAHNTTYHQTLKCSPTEIFNGRVPYNALDLKFSNSVSSPRNATDTQSLVDNENAKFEEMYTSIIRTFHKCKAYYDRKARASSMKVSDFAFLLNPKINTQSEKILCSSFKWRGLTK